MRFEKWRSQECKLRRHCSRTGKVGAGSNGWAIIAKVREPVSVTRSMPLNNRTADVDRPISFSVIPFHFFFF